MKTATVRDLRNEFARISKLIKQGETVQIINRGKPIARLVPEPKQKSWLGSMEGTIGKLPPDIDEPIDLEWDALK
jgi:antitoxin (DNA-binding transcriptional repressor) of toxin-antitoxin stability system